MRLTTPLRGHIKKRFPGLPRGTPEGGKSRPRSAFPPLRRKPRNPTDEEIMACALRELAEEEKAGLYGGNG